MRLDERTGGPQVDDQVGEVTTGNRFQRFVAPARARCGFGRLILGLIVITIVTVAWTVLLALAFAYAAPVPEGQGWGGAIDAFVKEIGAGTIRGQAFLLGSLFGGTIGVWLTVRLLHRRSLASVIGPSYGERGANLVRGFLITIIASGLIIGIGALMGDLPERSSLAFSTWLVWLVPMLALVLIQVASEEIVFRGYLLQQLAARFRSPLVWILVPAIVFTVLHAGGGPTPALSIAVLVVVFVFALSAAVVVWRTGSLWASIGLHFGHNLPLLLFFGAADDPLGGALFEYPAPTSLSDIYLTGAVEVAVLLFVISPLAPFPRGGHPVGSGLVTASAG